MDDSWLDAAIRRWCSYKNAGRAEAIIDARPHEWLRPLLTKKQREVYDLLESGMKLDDLADHIGINAESVLLRMRGITNRAVRFANAQRVSAEQRIAELERTRDELTQRIARIDAHIGDLKRVAVTVKP